MDSQTPALRASRLPSLTGMRFFAAFLVFYCHASAQAFYSDPGVTGATMRLGIGFGWLGVAFFFILSGFVLTWSARPGDTAPRFWRRRFVKIFPNHVVSWLAAIVFALVLGQVATSEITASRLVPSLFLVHAWVPDMDVINALHIPSWSLSCELLFYLAFPRILRLIGAIRPEHLWAWAGAIVAAIVAIPLLAQWLLPETPRVPWFPMSVWHYWAVYTAPPVRMLEFTLGIVMARIVISGRWINLGLLPALTSLVAGCALQWALVPSPWAMVAPTVVPLALVIAAGAAADARGATTLFAGRTAVWLGDVSFAVYMVHLLVLTYGHMVLGLDRTWSTPAAIGIQAGLLAVTIVSAWLLYAFVERPAMRWWGEPGSTRTASASRLEQRDASSSA